MLAIALAPRAQDDIVAIAAYTLEHWGDAQIVRYVDELHHRFGQLSRFP